MEEIMADKKPSVVMFSGGIDSTAVLKRLLVETDKNIFAHHIHIISGEGEGKFYTSETAAVNQIIPYMKNNYRDFNYSESKVDIEEMCSLIGYFPRLIKERIWARHSSGGTLGGFIHDIKICAYMGSILAHLIDAIEMYSGDSYNTGYAEELEGCDKISEGVWHPHKPVMFNRMTGNETKIDNINYLEKELLDMTWGCRKPQGETWPYTVCNDCATCDRTEPALLERA
jgi:hypothetical protein